MLSFPAQGELSVPCCLLTICNRCKYSLLINSLKELQSRVCVWKFGLCWLQLSCSSAKVTAAPSGSSRVLGEPCVPRICFPRGICSLCCRARTCHSLSEVSLGTKSSCKEWMSGRFVGAPCCSSVTPFPLRTGTGGITITAVSGTNPPRAGLLELCPSPGLVLLAPAVCACPGHWDQLPWESSGACCAPGEGPAALGSAQPGHQSPLLNQCLTLAAAAAGAFSKANSQTREPCGNKHRALHFY